MIRFLTILACVLIILFLAGGCLGLYYLIDSTAVEQGTAKVLDRAGEGMYAILICAAFAIAFLGMGFGLRAGAVPSAQAVSHLLMSKKMAGSIGAGSSARLPGGYEVSSPPDTQLRTEQFLPRNDTENRVLLAEYDWKQEG